MYNAGQEVQGTAGGLTLPEKKAGPEGPAKFLREAKRLGKKARCPWHCTWDEAVAGAASLIGMTAQNHGHAALQRQ